ncbi:nucleotidyltransferase family protein [Hyphomonadaceae bacterium ML37]|nr:nucleotidyltransferase family protein [Hyphomonadaceae bacterium ML37]
MTITTAMVMAAGVGSRMRPLTDDRCKALVAVDGKALIDWTLDKLAGAGVARAVVNVHHFADALETHLSGRTKPEILISDERDQLLETGGGLAKAAPLLGRGPIFTANIDALWVDGTQAELPRLADGFDPGRMDFRLMLARLDHTLGFDGPGDFYLDAEGRLTRRGERPTAPFAYAGVQVMNPRVLAGRAVEPFSTNRLWDEALAKGRVFGCVMDAFWMHVGDPQARDAAENRLRSGL